MFLIWQIVSAVLGSLGISNTEGGNGMEGVDAMVSAYNIL